MFGSDWEMGYLEKSGALGFLGAKRIKATEETACASAGGTWDAGRGICRKTLPRTETKAEKAADKAQKQADKETKKAERQADQVAAEKARQKAQCQRRGMVWVDPNQCLSKARHCTDVQGLQWTGSACVAPGTLPTTLVAQKAAQYPVAAKNKNQCKNKGGIWDLAGKYCHTPTKPSLPDVVTDQPVVVQSEQAVAAPTRYTVAAKNKNQCKKQGGIWDVGGKYCYVTVKPVSPVVVQPDQPGVVQPERAGVPSTRYVLTVKNKNQCKKQGGQWDIGGKYCYTGTKPASSDLVYPDQPLISPMLPFSPTTKKACRQAGGKWTPKTKTCAMPGALGPSGCGTGYYLDAASGTCIPISSRLGPWQNLCPSGQVINALTGECEGGGVQGGCPAGYADDGYGGCYPISGPVLGGCPSGYRSDGWGGCSPISGPGPGTCPVGYVPNPATGSCVISGGLPAGPGAGWQEYPEGYDTGGGGADFGIPTDFYGGGGAGAGGSAGPGAYPFQEVPQGIPMPGFGPEEFGLSPGAGLSPEAVSAISDECSAGLKFPQKYKDEFGEMEVLAIYCAKPQAQGRTPSVGVAWGGQEQMGPMGTRSPGAIAEEEIMTW